jgi:hypothetical protein
MQEKKTARQHIDTRLRFRLRVYFVIAVVLLFIMFENIAKGIFSLHTELGGLLLGGVIGVLVARMYKISWQEDMQKIVSQLDVVGGIILVFYIGFEIFREEILLHFLSSATVAALTLPIIAGIMLGRLFGTGRKIIRILREERVFGQ